MTQTEEAASSEASEADEEAVRAALDELPDGSGCAEIWDFLSEHRRQD